MSQLMQHFSMSVHPSVQHAFPPDHPNPVYLRFGSWPEDERSQNHATGWKEDGVSVYELDRHGNPIDPDGNIDRDIHHHDESCYEDGPDEHHTCGLGEGEWDPRGERGNDTREEMEDRVARSERYHRGYGGRHHDDAGHLVTGDLTSWGHDDEPLLRNVKRVGDWIDHRHLFIPTAEPHRQARQPDDEDYEPPEVDPQQFHPKQVKQASEDYWMRHRPVGETRVHEIPEEVIEHPEWYGSPTQAAPLSRYHCWVEHESAKQTAQAVRESHAQMKAAQGNPEHPVTVYRAVPAHVTDINPGDWVTLSPTYAQMHGDSHLEPGYKILKHTGPAKHVAWDEGSTDEFAYHGPKVADAKEHTDRLPPAPYHDEDGKTIRPTAAKEIHSYYRGLYLGQDTKSVYVPPGPGEKGIGHSESVPADHSDQGILDRLSEHHAWRMRGREDVEPQDRWPLYGSHWTDNHDLAWQFALDPSHGNWRVPPRPKQPVTGVVLEAQSSVPPEVDPLNSQYGETETKWPGRRNIDRVIAHVHRWDPEVHGRDHRTPTYVRSFEVPPEHVQKFGKVAAYDYQGGHRPPGPEYSPPLHDLTERRFPKNVYDDLEHYTHGGMPYDRESVAVVRRQRGNPDGDVAIYRAAPPGLTHINPGDWVALSRSYADHHGRERGGMSVYRATVKARDVGNGGNDIIEWGYRGEHPVPAQEVGRTKQAIQQRPDPDPVEYRHVEPPGWGGDFTGGFHSMQARLDGKQIGDLHWWDPGEGPWKGIKGPAVEKVEVAPAHRRRGLAAEMLRRAQEITPGIGPSDELTADGHAWRDAVHPESAGTPFRPSRMLPRLSSTIDDIMDLLGPAPKPHQPPSDDERTQQDAERAERYRKHQEWQATRKGYSPGDDLSDWEGYPHAEWVPIEVAKQFREHTGDQHPGSQARVDEIAEQLRAGRGMTDPGMLLHHNEENRASLGEGNHRLAAAEKAGWTHYPMRVVRMFDSEAKAGKGKPIPHRWRGSLEGRTPELARPSEVFDPQALGLDTKYS